LRNRMSQPENDHFGMCSAVVLGTSTAAYVSNSPNETCLLLALETLKERVQRMGSHQCVWRYLCVCVVFVPPPSVLPLRLQQKLRDVRSPVVIVSFGGLLLILQRAQRPREAPQVVVVPIQAMPGVLFHLVVLIHRTDRHVEHSVSGIDAERDEGVDLRCRSAAKRFLTPAVIRVSGNVPKPAFRILATPDPVFCGRAFPRSPRNRVKCKKHELRVRQVSPSIERSRALIADRAFAVAPAPEGPARGGAGAREIACVSLPRHSGRSQAT